MAQRQEEEDDEREHHFHVGVGSEAEEAHEPQLQQLAAGELVDLALGHAADVVVGRVGGLFGEEESEALEHLIAVQRSDGHVEEEAVEDGRGDVGQRTGQQQQRQSDENVREHARQSRLSNSYNSANK